LKDPTDLAAADPDALGLGGRGQRVQGPLRRLLLVGRGQAAVGLAPEPAGRVAANQGDDPAALQLRQPPGPTRAGLVAEVVDAALVEAVHQR
jgi:hypothetical protein